MQRQMLKQLKKEASSSNLPKYGAILLLLLLSVAVVACGASGGSSTANAAASQATPTAASINLNATNAAPTPGLPPVWCGIWVTNPSITGGTFNVYAKFTRQVNGNPVGIPGGAVSLNIAWGDGSTVPQTQYTLATGLAVFPVSTAGHYAGSLNKLSLITATFTSGNTSCSVGSDRPASFTIVAGAAPTKKATPTTTTSPPGNTTNPGIPGVGFPFGGRHKH